MKINNEFNLSNNEGDSRKAQNYFIIIHETANSKATGRNEATFMKRNWRNAYTTDIIGDSGIDYRIGEWGYVSWGALNANLYAPVQIELQHTTDPIIFRKNYEAYIELIRKACDTFNIPKTLDTSGKWTKGVKSHKWCSENFGGDHTDPYSYLAKMGISKEQLAKDIKNGIGGNNVTKKAEYWDKKGWYEVLKTDTFYTSAWFDKSTKSGWTMAKGSKIYFGGVADNASKTAKRGVVNNLDRSGKRYFSLNKDIVKFIKP